MSKLDRVLLLGFVIGATIISYITCNMEYQLGWDASAAHCEDQLNQIVEEGCEGR